MEKIEGVNLADLVAEVEGDLIDAKRAEVRRAIQGIFTDIAKWAADLKIKEREIAALNDKIAKARVKLGQLREENWSVLPQTQTPANDQNA